MMERIRSKISLVSKCFCPIRNTKSFFIRPQGALKPLDGIRAFSIMYVVLFHSFMLTGVYYKSIGADQEFIEFLASFPMYLNWVWHGGRGVDMFFVLSGFLIGTILMSEQEKNNRISISRFYIRRFFRLMPLYLIAMLIFRIDDPLNTFSNVWANILYVNNFISFDESFMNWTWSLAVEEQFYIIFPLFLIYIFYATEKKFLVLTMLMILSFLIRLLLIVFDESLIAHPIANHMLPTLVDFDVHYVNVMYDNLYTRFGSLIIGVMAGYLYLYKKDDVRDFFLNRKYLPHIFTFISLITIYVILIIPVQNPRYTLNIYWKIFYTVTNSSIFSLAIAYLLLGMLFPKGILRISSWFLSWSLWYPIAQSAYSVYLFHLAIIPIASICAHLVVASTTLIILKLFLTMIFTIIITMSTYGFFSYILIEKPFMNMRSIYKPSSNPEK